MEFLRLMTKGYTLLFKAVSFALVGFTLIMLATSPGRASASVVLKENAILKDTNIMLGDIFDGLDRGQDRILGAAPRPGQDMTLNARTLMRIAIATDLPWRPSSSADQIVLRRPATIVEADAVQNIVEDALDEEGAGENFRLIVPEGIPEIVLPVDQPATAEITRISYDPASKKFEAGIAAPSKEKSLQTFSIKGTLEHLINVPVLSETMRKGMVIGKRDISYVEMPETRVRHDMILEPEELIGMTPRRVIVSGEPVKLLEIEAPQIVSRGEMVTMILKDGTLYLTAMGKALEHGAKGDVIRVVNTTSNKTIEATVTGSKEVTVINF